jgi:Protein of unknown function (DUF3153)
VKNSLANLLPPIPRLIQHLVRFCFPLILLFTLSGCVQYRLGLQFNWNASGMITQNLDIEPALVRLSGFPYEQFIRSIKKRTEGLGGKVDTIQEGKLGIQIPFKDPKELETKFNRFFNDPLVLAFRSNQSYQSYQPIQYLPVQNTLPAPTAKFSVQTQTWLLVDAYTLTYDVDLTQTSLPLPSGNLLMINPAQLVNLEFALSLPFAPWQSNATRNENGVLVWDVIPGQQNRITATFLLPNLWGGLALSLGIMILVIRFAMK